MMMSRFGRFPQHHVLVPRVATRSAAPIFRTRPGSALRIYSTKGNDANKGSQGLSAALLFGLVASSILTGIGISRLPQLSSVAGDGALTKDVHYTGLDWKEKVYPAFDLKSASAVLRAGQKSLTPSGGVSRVDIFKLASNSPVEDEMAYEYVDVTKGQKWHFWGVYDGHAGWATSAVLRRSLISYVARALHLPNLNDNAAVDESITNAFLSLDNEILSSGLAALKDDAPPATVISRMAPATAGSCALLAIFDPSTSNLRVACVGDSRAVLGRSNPENPGEWIAKPLSEDQTGFNKKELARILAQHPGESPVDLKSGRVLGIAVSRAFGDNRWKWPLEALQEQGKRFFGGQPRPTYFSPPYLTAEPVITTTKVQSGDFVVLASDGLWDRISSEDAVKCVSKWVEEVRKGTKLTGQSPVESNPVIQYPTEKKANDWKFHLEDMVVEEENAATNLVKNAFGGKRRDLFCSVVSSQTPHSRSVRDDITVQIIFFGDISEKAQK